jgi:hypothetical protein
MFAQGGRLFLEKLASLVAKRLVGRGHGRLTGVNKASAEIRPWAKRWQRVDDDFHRLTWMNFFAAPRILVGDAGGPDGRVTCSAGV